jgi:hypothetical protein
MRVLRRLPTAWLAGSPLEAIAPPPEAEEGFEAAAHSAAHLTDLTCPASWYPAARMMRRRIVAHMGPTNSGKTHAALSELKAAGSGVYCGPLRLLAWEVRYPTTVCQLGAMKRLDPP